MKNDRQGVSLQAARVQLPARARSAALNRLASMSPNAAATPTTIAEPNTWPPRTSRDAGPSERGRWRGLASSPPPANTAFAPSPLDERAHPPRARRRRRAQEKPARAARDLADVGRRAHRREPVSRPRDGREGRAVGAAYRLEADIRVDVAEGQAPARVENEAELRRQRSQGSVLGEPRAPSARRVGRDRTLRPDRCR